jgi:hypothetical protein
MVKNATATPPATQISSDEGLLSYIRTQSFSPSDFNSFTPSAPRMGQHSIATNVYPLQV